MPGSKKSLYDVSLKNKLVNPTKNQAIFEKLQEGGSIRVYKRIATINIIYHDPQKNRNIRNNRSIRNNGSKRKHSKARQRFSKTTRCRRKYYSKNNNKNISEIRRKIRNKYHFFC